MQNILNKSMPLGFSKLHARLCARIMRMLLAGGLAWGGAFDVRAGDPPSGKGYIILGLDCNSPTPCCDSNADSLSISEDKVGSTVWQAVLGSTNYNRGYFGSSMTAPDDTFYTTFPTMRRWYSFDVGSSQTAEDRAPYSPPNQNYDYWVGSTYSLCTPNDGSVDTHYGQNHVYKFNGRSLTLAGTITHCSKGTSLCDFGTNVILKSGHYTFPALGTHTQPAVRMKAKVAEKGSFAFDGSSGMSSDRRCYLDVSLSGDASGTVSFPRCATQAGIWFWCGDCSKYLGKIKVADGLEADATKTSLIVSNVTCAGSVEVGAYQFFEMKGASAFVETLTVSENATFEVKSGESPRIGTLALGGMLKLYSGAGLVTVTNAFTASSTASIYLDTSVSGAVLAVPESSSFTAEQFASAVRRGESTGSASAIRSAVADGVRTFYVENPASVASKTITVETDAVIDGGDGLVRVSVANGANLTLTSGQTSRMAVKSENSTVTLKRLLDDWQDVPLLWLDASAETSISNIVVTYADSCANYSDSPFLEVGQTIRDSSGNPYIKGWLDCRDSQQTVKMWNERYDNPHGDYHYHKVMWDLHPRRVLNGLDGKAYIAFDRPKKDAVWVEAGKSYSVTNTYGTGNTLARIYFTKYAAAASSYDIYPMKPRYAFMVYGSHEGGGGALIGGNENFLRAGTVGKHTKDDAIFVEKAPPTQVWLDGAEVNPKTTGLNGGWQVIAIDFLATTNQFSGLGYGVNTATDNGGQRYAEVIFVTEELTERQRQAIEMYLAEKWGLASQYNYPDWTKSFATVYGTGTVKLENDATLGGAFAGTINLNGKSLVIDGTNLPPTAASIDTTNLEGWYDPDAAGKVTEVSNVKVTVAYKDTSKGSVEQVKSPDPRMNILQDVLRAKTSGGIHLYGQPQRAPWLNDAPRGFGAVRTWMDFSNLMDVVDKNTFTNPSNGNVLRFSKYNSYLGSDGATYQQPMQTLFFVQDSVHGGGHPFADGANVNAPKLYKSRTGENSAVGKPIYPSGSDGILTQGLTCLDGREVNGLTESFGARPEVVTVVPTNTFNLVAFGQIGNSENIKGGQTELLGEVMIYNRKVAEPERRKVEAYLSHKWLGIEQAGYSALTNATVTGSGSVTAASAALLPKFDADFTGTVNVPLTDGLDFTLVTSGGATSVAGALDFGGGTLVATDNVTVRVATSGAKPKSGSYKLLGWATQPAATWTLEMIGWTRENCALRVASDGLYLDLAPLGLTILLR